MIENNYYYSSKKIRSQECTKKSFQLDMTTDTKESTSSTVQDVNLSTSVTFNPLELNKKFMRGEISPEEFLKTLDAKNISYIKFNEDAAIVVQYEYNGTEYEVRCNLQKAPTNNPNTITSEDFTGLELYAVVRYFIPMADGTYTMNQINIQEDFPDKEINSLEDLKKAIAETVKTDTTETTGLMLGKSDAAITSTESDPPSTSDTPSTLPTRDDNNDNGMTILELQGIGAEELRAPIAEVADSIVAVCKEAINYKNSFQVGYSYDAEGNINFTTGSDAEKVFNTILEKLKSKINRYAADSLEKFGGESALKYLLQAAWVEASSETTYNSAANTNDFINKIMTNLDSILAKIATNPEYRAYYVDDCYKDSNLTNGLPHINEQNINYSNPEEYDTGEVHLDDDASDKKFQETMNALLENIYNKYPNIDKTVLKELFLKAQNNALIKANDIPVDSTINTKSRWTGTLTGSAEMSELVDLVLYHFDKLFKAAAKDTTFAARTEDAPSRSSSSSQTAERNSDIKDGAAGILNSVDDVADSIVAVCKEAIGYKETIHTEFGVDNGGNIVFQEESTTTVFNTILDKLKSKISRNATDALEKLGGEEVLKQLLQAAWITTYNSFNSSQSNNTTDFINKVMQNLEKMLNKLQTNPEYLEVFTQRVSYADRALTSGLKHYNTKTTAGDDERIKYSGEPTIYADGTVHIANTTDDNDYQTTMSALLNNLLNKYSSLETDVVTSVFQKAQLAALKTLRSNTSDCPYGTGNNSHRVEDLNKNWGGKDNRKGDDYYIDMDQLVQMTLYYFDKLIYAELLK